MSQPLRGKALLRVIDRSLREGAAIEIDGFGSFRLEQDSIVFHPNGRIRVFLAYAVEDRAEVKKLYRALQKAGLEPWMDHENLLPGQNWPRAIERAIELSDFFIGCFSRRSAVKHGHFQCELRYALDLAGRVPLEDIFFLPIRLNECEIPQDIARRVQYLDLFPDWQHGVNQLVKTMRRQMTERARTKVLG